jgi:hypothetical protein
MPSSSSRTPSLASATRSHQAASADDDQLRVEVDIDRLHSRDRRELLRDRGLAMVAVHGGDAIGHCLVHRRPSLLSALYTP